MRPDAHDFLPALDGLGRDCRHVIGQTADLMAYCGLGPLDSVHGAATLLPTEAITLPDAPTQPVRLGQRTTATLADVSEVRHEAMSAYVDLGAALDAFRREAGLWLAGIAVCLAALGGGLLVLAVLR